jgi:O-antigen/teichoic acid export membrane protein
MTGSPETPISQPAEGHARRLASGSAAQQVSQVSGLLAMFVILTVLARRLSLTELGLYGTLSSLAGYLLVTQNAIAGAAVKTMSAALEERERDFAFSTALALYVAAGLITGLVVAVIGGAVTIGFDLSPSLERQGLLGSALVGLVTAVGFPATVYRDAMRASQLFGLVAMLEVAALITYGSLVLGLTFADAPLAAIIAASGTIPLLSGAFCFVVVKVTRLPYAFTPRRVDRKHARELLGLAGFLGLTELAAVVVYALDRVILGLFRSAATVAIYEGPVRVHNLIRALNGALSVTVLPTASSLAASGDDRRLRELVIRGSRYTLALMVPLTVTAMVLGGDILAVWLGERFREGAGALAILCGYWLVTAALAVFGPMLVALGRAPTLARYAWAVAIMNLTLSLALTPWLGIYGVSLGTTIPYLIIFPFSLRLSLSLVPVRLADIVREAWLPAYSLGLALAGLLGAAVLTLDLEHVVPLAAVAFTGLAAYWGAYYVLWLQPDERVLARDVALGPFRRKRRTP